MKEFMFLIRKQEGHGQTEKGEQKEFLEACRLYISKLKKEGRLIAAQPLERQGKLLSGNRNQWKDVPFNESKEVIAGYYHIRAIDIDEAMEIAKDNPEFEYSETARIEIRPIKVKEESTGFVYPECETMKI
ncbi:MAG: YciI family protein [Flavisolibacter sp.]